MYANIERVTETKGVRDVDMLTIVLDYIVTVVQGPPPAASDKTQSDSVSPSSTIPILPLLMQAKKLYTDSNRFSTERM